MEIKVKIENLKKVQWALNRYPKIALHNINEAIKNSALAIRDSAKMFIISGQGYSKAPFQTGRMYRTTMMEMPYPLRAEIYPTVDYAIFVHEGLGTSSKYGRRPFLEDAIKERQEWIQEQFEKAVENSLNQTAAMAK